MNIRIMTIEDFDQVHALWMSIKGFGIRSVDDSKEGIERFLKRNPTTSVVAEEDGKIVGAILCGHDGRRGCLYHVCVDVNHRMRGIGKAMVVFTMEALKKEGINKVSLIAFTQNDIGNAFWNEIDRISEVDTVTGHILKDKKTASIFAASHFVTDEEKLKISIDRILKEKDERVKYFKENNKLIEAQRIEERVNYDMEMLSETGFCRGIENYSRHIALKEEGVPPCTLIDFFPKDFLLVIDESHVSIPQVRAMYNGDRARKMNLVDYGFRLPSALDNRPLKFEEFESKLNNVIYVSATPGDYELGRTGNHYIQQIIRPTGLLDPKIEVRPTKNQIDNLLEEIEKNNSANERTIITTLTIRMAEELTNYLKSLDIKVAYLHNEVKSLERLKIIRDLRLGKYDVLVGINLLREGLDIPEVSLIAIMDADKQGFLRSTRSLIQTIGRAARNAKGRVIMYADTISDSMNEAITETERRRNIQEEYNRVHNIVPKTIIKEIPEVVSNEIEVKPKKEKKLTKEEKLSMIEDLTKEMKEAAGNLDFERAMQLRDIIFELESE